MRLLLATTLLLGACAAPERVICPREQQPWDKVSTAEDVCTARAYWVEDFTRPVIPRGEREGREAPARPEAERPAPEAPDRPQEPPAGPPGANPGNDKPVGKSPFDGVRGEVPSGRALQ